MRGLTTRHTDEEIEQPKEGLLARMWKFPGKRTAYSDDLLGTSHCDSERVRDESHSLIEAVLFPGNKRQFRALLAFPLRILRKRSCVLSR